jgi:hypothetical protein
VTAGQFTGQPPSSDGAALLQPKLTWPREMTVGRRYLVEVDLNVVSRDGTRPEWPAAEEEYAYTCALDGGGEFDLWAVHDANVLVHRFGGSYCPAQYVVTPRARTGRLRDEAAVEVRWLVLSIVNRWGVPVGTRKMQVTVHAKAPETVQPRPRPVPAEISPTPPDQTVGDQVRIRPDDDRPPAPPTTPDSAFRERQPAWSGTRPTAPDAGYRASDREDLAGLLGRSQPPAGLETDRARLAETYNLVGLRRTRGGSAELDLLPLFYPGASTGDRATFTALCAQADEHGTVFAVVAYPPASGDSPQLRTKQSASIPPGTYRVTAELRYPYPEHVRFYGLPTAPRSDARDWAEIMSGIPDRLPEEVVPVHLIVAIETSGPDRLVADRIECARRLVQRTADGPGPVCSVISYGPHTINVNNRHFPDVPMDVLTWEATAPDALNVLEGLARRPSERIGYPFAAQIECVLTEVERRFASDGTGGRPVLVTIGARHAHPPVRDVVSQIIPCPKEADWRSALGLLRTRYLGMSFGAIHDVGRSDELWDSLGADASATLEDFSSGEFAVELGLGLVTQQLVPLPVLSAAGAD